jgi:hypothetical protein
MARKLRVQYPGAIYHVMNRGDRREKDLLGRRKGDPQKVRLAARLRRETTVTLEWIAARLGLGAPTHVANLLHRYERKETNSEETLL